MSVYLKRILEARPDLAGVIVFFSPTKQQRLACVLREDGTLSPTTSPDMRFSGAADLARAWCKGEVKTDNGKTMSRRLMVHSKFTKLSFPRDVFLKPGRKVSLKNVVPARLKKPAATSTNAQSSAQVAAITSNFKQTPPNTCSITSNMEDTSNIGSPTVVNAGNFRRRFSWMSYCQAPSATSAASGRLSPTDLLAANQLLSIGAYNGNSSSAVNPTAAVYESSNNELLLNPMLLTDLSTTDKAPVDVYVGGPQSSPPSINRMAAVMRKPCPGISRHELQSVISNRQWDQARFDFSPLISRGDRCWSKYCDGQIVHYRELCYFCSMAQKALCGAGHHPKKLQNEMHRIQCPPMGSLTKKKLVLLQKARNDALADAQRKKEEIRFLKRELEQYRPKYAGSRSAIKSIVRKINVEEAKLRSPACHWFVKNMICGFEAPSIAVLNDHIGEAHLLPQVQPNGDKTQSEHSYECRWYRCTGMKPIRNIEFLRRHVAIHSGNAETEKRLVSIRERILKMVGYQAARRYEKNQAD